MHLDQFNAHRSTIQTSLGEVSCVDIGAGPPALFAHGVAVTSALWRNVIGEVRAERRCVAPDLPAHGGTPLRANQDVSFPAVADMLAALCDALGLDAVDLVGNDTGGVTAQIFAARHRDRVRTLTLTNCNVHDTRAFKETLDSAARGEFAPAMVEVATDLRLARQAALSLFYEHPKKVPDEVVRSYFGRFEAIEAGREVERFMLSLKAEHLIAVESALKQLSVPTLIVWGTGDRFYDVSWAYRLRDMIPGAKDVVELDGAKLFFPDERCEEFTEILRRFLNQHSPIQTVARA